MTLLVLIITFAGQYDHIALAIAHVRQSVLFVYFPTVLISTPMSQHLRLSDTMQEALTLYALNEGLLKPQGPLKY